LAERQGAPFRNTLLRHIHVTLELRHPWLRTVPEGGSLPLRIGILVWRPVKKFGSWRGRAI